MEKDQICVVADKCLIRHPVWTGAQALQNRPVLWLEVTEENKSLETVSRIWDFLFEHAITRRGLLICIGGGALTDMGGFAAATYKRGMSYINVPTTLLAMIDAASGGKTGINYRGIKNSIGVFAAPRATILCPEWLSTLSPQQFLSGFAEMLKTGLIDGQALWNGLLQYDLDKMDTASLSPLIADCMAVKQRIVAQDPQENGIRKVLNFGHTFGHALERKMQVPHGYAVLYGMIAELYLSVTRLGCPRESLQQLTRLMLQYYGKPQCKCSDRDQLLALMQQDKKNEQAAQINCTLLQAVGTPLINQSISALDANEALDYLFSL
ncbi:MAG: 3-dehydroquinate synthase [Bacteroidales bacterium]|nr:3-dehydroquinate synthase [Bacteroidales bacterium]MDY6407062.1 3-dehydroquinate synthase [Bacteroidales bacterium]